MKRLFIITALLLCLFSCENMRDRNGDLGGMWQLLEWKKDTTVVATNEDGIYYHFELKLMKLQHIGHGNYYLARFTHTHDSLIVGEVYSQPFDSIVSINALKDFGVPEDGKFHIDALSDSHMVLSSDEGTMMFRKY